MSTQLLTTKLNIPPPRLDLVPRPRLIEQLNLGLSRKLILISAPAGFGKTTLTADWLQKTGLPVAWLSLDGRDNDPIQFWIYFVNALQAVQADLGETILPLLQSPQPTPIEALLTELINQLAPLTDQMILVLDDYHLIDNAAIHHNVEFLIEHQPLNFHLILISRSDPQIRLARIRGTGQLAEIREAELRFTKSEATEFLVGVMGLPLSEQNITALELRTEGWAVGLQLAGLALQGREDIDGFVRDLTGGHQFIIDYLTEEVYECQPEEIQDFLIQTCILERFNAPLCDAVTGKQNGAATIQLMDQLNLFVLPLDEYRQWYRYHHLFADLLRYRLEQSQPARVSELHGRASAWYASQDLIEDALHHALAAGDFNHAAELIEAVGEMMIGQGKIATLKGWIERLPEPIVRKRPIICVGQAWVFHLTGQFEAIAPRLGDAERALQRGTYDQRMVAVLQGNIALLRAYIIEYQNDLPRAVELLQEALTYLPEDHLYLRSVVNLRLGIIYKHQSSWDAAVEAARQARTLGEAAGNLYSALYASFLLAEVLTIQGQLLGGAKLCQNTIDQYLASQGERVLPGLGFVYIKLGQILYEWNDLEAAAQTLGQGLKLGEKVMAVWPVMRDGLTSLAWLKQVEGEPDQAQSFLEQASDIVDRSPERLGKTDVEAWGARLWLAQNKLAAAIHWAQAYQATGIDARSELAEMTLARVLLTQGKSGEALEVLEPFGQRLEATSRIYHLIQVLVLKALAYQAQNDTGQAVEALGQALSLAEPEGYCRTFVDEGPPMATLLAQCLLQPGQPADQTSLFSPDYVNQLLAAFPSHETESPPSPTSPALAYLADPLKDREIEILNLLAAGMTAPEIAAKLYLAPSTVKWYLRNIYSKLGVHRRSEAIAQAQTLGLLK